MSKKEIVKKPIVVKPVVVKKPVIPAQMFAILDDKGENYLMEIEIPGVKKENIELKMLDDIVQVKAERKDALYYGHLHFPYRVDPKKAEAEFTEGLLSVKVPVEEKRAHPTTIKIK